MKIDSGDRHTVRTRQQCVLVVEDLAAARVMAVEALEAHGFSTVSCEDGAEALRAIRSEPLNAVVLDLGLPSLSGFDLLTELRRDSDIPVVIVSGRSDEGDRLQGLRLGADDYLVKPYSPRELGERVRAVLRRANPPSRTQSLVFDGLELDLSAREVRVAGRVVALTPLEFSLLVFLARSPRRAFSRADLLRGVWGSNSDWQTQATVTEHVRRLRRKLEPSGRARPWIVTVRGAGYRFEP
jgi:DNA-binding response OmpR family regulator